MNEELLQLLREVEDYLVHHPNMKLGDRIRRRPALIQKVRDAIAKGVR